MLILFQVSIVILLAKVLGEFFSRFGLPETSAFIVAGILVGPVFELVDVESLRGFGIISLVLLLFFGGLKGRLATITLPSLPFYVSTTLLPFLGGLGIAVVAGYPVSTGVVIGAALITVSISIALGTLIELGQMQTRVGTLLSSLTVFTNILGVIAVVIASSISGGAGVFINIFMTIGKILLLALLFYMAFYFLPRLNRYGGHLKTPYASFTLLLVFMFLVSVLVEQMGFSMVLGAFVAGLVFGQAPGVISEEFLENIRLLLGGFFVVFFFVTVGMQMSFSSDLWQGGTLLILTLFFLTKFFSGYFGGILSGCSNRESIVLGTSLFPISINMGLAIIVIGKEGGLIDSSLYGVFVAFAVLSSVITPALMGLVLKTSIPSLRQ